MSDSITRVARRIDAHYTKVAEAVVPPPPRFRARRARSGVVHVRWAVVAALLVVSLLGAWLGTRTTESPSHVTGVVPRLPSPVAIEAPTTDRCPSAVSGPQTLPAGCRVAFALPSMIVTTLVESRIVVAEHTVIVEHGWMAFDVEPRKDAPLSVEFDRGEIQVLGTIFSVFQDEVRGHIELVEGKLRIVESSGATHLLDPGGRFGWERAAASRTIPSKRPSAAASAETIDDVARLRSRKAYTEARALLRRLRARAETAHEREVLDYELGTILEAEHAVASKQCEHWQTFASRYRHSRYAGAVADRIAALRCDE